MMAQNALEFINGWLQELADSGKLIVVEGKKDRAALQRLGITNVFSLDKKPLFQAVEEISAISDKVVLLTDLDNEGKKLYSRLNTDLQRHGVQIDNYFREALFRRTALRQIEGLDTYVYNLGK
ncbi:MAG: TOPRIM protein [archaeon GW2011_AR3]|nr:MAG: TOPRIM protein [archaeon GW2011_AR3]MBS3109246.1 toprim domain-containing protein [Candidatus Woesearchaeota archaeon]